MCEHNLVVVRGRRRRLSSCRLVSSSSSSSSSYSIILICVCVGTNKVVHTVVIVHINFFEREQLVRQKFMKSVVSSIKSAILFCAFRPFYCMQR